MAAVMVALDDVQRGALERAGFFLDPYQSGRRTLYIIREEDVERAVNLLECQLQGVRNSQLEGISIAELAPRNGNHQAQGSPPRRVRPYDINAVDVRLVGPNVNSNRHALDPMSQAAQEILAPLGRNVRIHAVGGKRSVPLEDGSFHVHLFASPNGERRYQPPVSMWALPVTSRTKGYRPSGMGTPIATDSDWVAAELVGDNLYIHHDIMDGSEADVQIFRRILTEALLVIPGVPVTVQVAQARAAAETGRAKARKAYIDACSVRVGDSVKELQHHLGDLRGKVEHCRVELVKATRAATDAQARLDGVQAGNSDLLERFGKEYDNLTRHPKVTDVQVEGDVVKVFTTVLNCRHPRTNQLHEIGEFRIEIHAGKPGYVVWKNLTRSVDAGRHGMQAPHISDEGRACLGNTADTFAQLIADYEFAQAAFLAIEFVESVNIDDPWGRHLDKWPLAKEQDKE